MNRSTASIIQEMVLHDQGNPHRVQHFMKVYAFAQMIATEEKLNESQQELIEVAAVMHDIGIRDSIKKYGSNAGPLQEKEGPPLAKAMLSRLSFPQPFIDRICFLIGHHHTYTDIDGMDYQILIEADFLVNIFEHKIHRDAIQNILIKYFQTETGKNLLKSMYLS